MPLEEIPDGFDAPNTLHHTRISAVIQFAAGVPTMCNVAYGIDTTYGAIGTMPMMAGGVPDHSVTLRGLTPNTTYHYRMTLTDEQARVYQSEDFTFTTSAAEPVPPAEQPEGENVASLSAAATVIGVSSSSGDNDSSFGANNAVDGQTNTEWSSKGDADDAWIEIELDPTYDVHTIRFWPRTVPNHTAQIFSFTVTTNDGEPYGPFGLADSSQKYYFPMEFTARTLRFDAAETNTGNTGAVEIELYGAPHGE